MRNLLLKTDPHVLEIFARYPKAVRIKIEQMRKLILDTASELEEIQALEETLKWGEPSYLTKTGSTIRIDWKAKTPEQYAMYFSCTTSLVPTFRIVFRDTLNFEGNRAIIFSMNDKIPKNELKKCITAGLTYHKVKKLPLLGL